MATPTETPNKPKDDQDGQHLYKPSDQVYDEQNPSDEQMRQITGIGVGEEDQMDASARNGAKKDLAQREKDAAGEGATTKEPKAADREELGAKEQAPKHAGERKSWYKPGKGGRHKKKKGLSKRLGGRKKWMLSTLLVGGAGVFAAIIFNFGSSLLPNLSLNMDDNRLKRITRNFTVSMDTVVKSKLALASTGDETYRTIIESYRDPSSGLIAKVNKLRPGRVAQNMLIDAEFQTRETTIPGTNIKRQRISAVTLGDRSVFIPQNQTNWAQRVRHPVSHINSLRDFRRDIRTLANNYITQTDPNASLIKRKIQSLVIAGQVSKELRENLRIKRWRWSKAEVDAANQENTTREDARVKETQRTYNETTDGGARPRRGASGHGAATEEVDKQNACMAETQCAREVTQSGDGLAPEVKRSLSSRFSPNAFRRIANGISGISAFGYLLCLVNQSSIGAAAEIIDSNSSMAWAGYESGSSAAAQQIYTAGHPGDSRTNASLTGGLNDQVNAFGGAGRSNIMLRASGQPYDTSDSPSPQASGVGTYGTDGLGILPSAARSVFDSAIGQGFCGIVGNTFGAVAVDLVATVVSFFGGPIGVGAKAGMTTGSKIVARQIAKQFGNTLRQQFTKRGLATNIAFASAEQLTTLVARTLTMQRMGAAFNGAAQGEALLNQWDAGATVYAQDADRMQNASRPMTTQEYNAAAEKEEAFRTAVMQSQSFSERYFALNNPQSLLNNVAMNLYTNFNFSGLSSLLQNSADILNPAKLFAGLPFVAQKSTSAQQAGYLDSPILSREYGVTQWGWTDDEEAAYTSDPDYGLLYNEKVLEDSGQREDLLDKYGKCFDPTTEGGSMGNLLADGHIHRDQNANVVADRGGDCAPDKIGALSPERVAALTENDNCTNGACTAPVHTVGSLTFASPEAALAFRLRVSLRNEQALDQMLEVQDPGTDIDDTGTLPPSQQEEFALPMHRSDIVAISDYYNTCFSSDLNCSDGRHAGLDFSTGGAQGDPILAMATGTVRQSTCAPLTGCYMVVEVTNPELYPAGNGEPLFYNYQHMQQRSSYGVGDTVERGDEVGRVGLTGRTSGAHLHFGVATRNTTGSRSNRTDLLNPACLLPRQQLSEIQLSKSSPQTRQGITASLFGGCD